MNLVALSRALSWPRFSVVVNCAGFTDVDAAEEQPNLANRVNAEFVSELASFCLLTNTRLIQISTNYVFDGRQGRPYLISDTPAPLQQYGLTKLRGEHAVQAAVSQGARAAIVRTGWLYGSHAARAALPDRLALQLLAGQAVRLTDQLGAPTWAADVAEYLLRLATLPDAEFVAVHHALAAGSVSWYEFGLRIVDDLGLNRELVQHRAEGEVAGAVRPVNGLLGPSAVAGYSIPDWLSSWQRYLPEFRQALGR